MIDHQDNLTTIDLLPPHGKDEITARGEHADEVSFAALAVVAVVLLLIYYG